MPPAWARRSQAASHVLPLLAIGAIASVCGIALGLLIDWFPAAASEEAEDIDTLWDVLVIASVPVFVLVETVVLYSVWSFRMRPGEELKDGPPIHGNTRLEVIWTAIPAIMLVALCSYAYVVLHDIEKAEASEMKVRVVGEQFTWTFFYPGEGGKEVASNQLYLPEGQPVKLRRPVQGRAPRLLGPRLPPEDRRRAGHHDALPHDADKTGNFPVVCAELCGLGHSVMRQTAHVVSQGDFDAWLDKKQQAAGGGGGGEEAGGGGGGAAPDGKTLFTSGASRLRLLPHARRRRHRRHHRPGPRRGAQGQGRGLHPAVDRGAQRRDRQGLPGWDHADELRRHPQPEEIDALADYLVEVATK